jgi:hypothetical protein
VPEVPGLLEREKTSEGRKAKKGERKKKKREARISIYRVAMAKGCYIFSLGIFTCKSLFCWTFSISL